MSVKKGDILTSKLYKHGVMVLGTVGDVVFISAPDDFKRASKLSYHQDELAEYFILPEEKWVPEDGAEIWYVDFNYPKGVTNAIYINNDVDKLLIAINAAYPTKEAALAAYEKCKAAMAI